ncbi:MAG: rhomboid family intramembrane serine protease [Dysgonamonadaceae bacterium]|nr:rhomboid family intramembrane serine protease [Dysgonamonadaceae bacterium]
MSNYQNNNFLSAIPPVTRNILIINFIVWLACFVLGRSYFDLSNILGLHFPGSQGFYLFQTITYMFTHVAFAHFFFNMFAVFMFGGSLENRWGPKKFLTYYMVTGIGAGLVQLLICYLRVKSMTGGIPDDVLEVIRTEGFDLLQKGMNYSDPGAGNLNLMLNSVTIGASGAVFGVLLAFGMLFPDAPLFLMFIPIPIKAKYFVIGYGLIELYLGVANRSGDNVAHFAHLGGMIFGILLILYWKNKDKKNGNFYQRY